MKDTTTSAPSPAGEGTSEFTHPRLGFRVCLSQSLHKLLKGDGKVASPLQRGRMSARPSLGSASTFPAHTCKFLLQPSLTRGTWEASGHSLCVGRKSALLQVSPAFILTLSPYSI